MGRSIASIHRIRKILTNYILASSSLEVTLAPGLRVKTNFGINSSDFSGYYFTPSDTRQQQQYGNATSTTLNFYNQSANNTFEWLWENTLAYTKTFGEHSIDFVGGVSAQDNTFRTMFAQGNNLVSDQLRDLQDLPSITNIYGYQYTTTLESQFARVNYSFMDKYLVTGTVRRDGSSKFGPGKQYGVFPSGSVAWKIKQENFMKDVTGISDLKIRASYGQIGSQFAATPYQFLPLYSPGPPQNNSNNNGYPFGKGYQPGIVQTVLADSGLTWESSHQTDIGLDLAVLDNALTFTVDYYRKESKNFLLNLPLSAQTGFTYRTENVGSLLNDGIEFGATYSHTTSSGFHYNLGLNLTTVNNKLLSLTNDRTQLPNIVDLGFSTTGSNNWGTFSQTVVGGPVGEFYGYKSAGIFQTQKEIDDLNANAVAKNGAGSYYQPTTTGPLKSATPGDRKYLDLNGDGVVNAADETALGSPLPKLYGGVTFDGSYKAWDFSIFLYGTYGNKIFNYEERTLESFGSSTGSVGLENIGLKYYQNAWTACQWFRKICQDRW